MIESQASTRSCLGFFYAAKRLGSKNETLRSLLWVLRSKSVHNVENHVAGGMPTEQAGKYYKLGLSRFSIITIFSISEG